MGAYKRMMDKLLEPDDYTGALTRGLTCIKAASDSLVVIEGHKGIESYSESLVLFGAGKHKIKISGSGISMPYLDASFAEIRGRIDGVEFVREKSL